jgi:UDP-N-acetylmuramate dehydrogenase
MAANDLRSAFGAALREQAPLARYTSARIGGPAEYLVEAGSASELAEQVQTARRMGLAYFVLGGGSNVLVSDAGVRGLVILNHARGVEFREEAGRVIVHAEAGVNLGSLARQCVQRGYAGLEWAATVPGTLGGAVLGNAGAHGGDLAGNFFVAGILQPDGVTRQWEKSELGFGYRTSALKRRKGHGPELIVLWAELALNRGDPAALQAKVDEFTAHRKRTQPPGASMGSMFKNPPGDYAGRLIEAAGLKGRRLGQAEISNLHGNFFVNRGEARAAEVRALIQLAHDTVQTQFGVDLELEVELVGEWS